jgi:hypothetical protein
MDWFRRQRRAKRVASEDDTPGLPAPDDEGTEERDPGEALNVPQPLLVELTPPAARPTTLEVPQPLRVELSAPLAAVDLPQPLQVEFAASQPLEVKLAPRDEPLGAASGAQGILAAEFAYIAQTTVQNSEDRVSGFFFVSAAAVLGAAIGLKSDPAAPPWLYLGFALIFGVLVALGWLAVRQLAELRKAWLESIDAMNRLKEYYYTVYPEAERLQIFKWTNAHRPQPFKADSLAYQRSQAIAVICWAFTVAGIVCVGLALDPTAIQSPLAPGSWLTWVGAVGIVAGILVYRWLLDTYRKALPTSPASTQTASLTRPTRP